MKARFVQEGNCIDYTPESPVDAGDVVVIGTLVGVANHSIPAGVSGAVALEGVFEVGKDAAAITAGAAVYWKSDPGVATATSEGNVAMGRAVAGAGAEDAVVRVKLG